MFLFLCVLLRSLMFFLIMAVSWPEGKPGGSFRRYQTLCFQTGKHVIGPVLHTGAAIDKEICFLQVLDIGCGRFPVMGFCAGRDHVCHLRFITADFDGKIIHGIKTGHYLQFLPVRILCFNLSTEFF